MIDVDYNEYKETIAQNMKLIVENHDLKQEIERLTEKNEELRALYFSEREVKEDYKSKVNKAIEYIENELSYGEYSEIDNILKILKGE